MSLTAVLSSQQHRPTPLPRGPWVMTQWWRELLFAHYPVPPQSIAHLIPAPLTLDLRDGDAWVAVVPFRMTGVRPRLCPPLPGLSSFPELNLRTYVVPRHGGLPGVYFWSLEAANPIAVTVARRLFHLPYMHATMSCDNRDGLIHYASQRTHSGEPPAAFRARYGPSGPPAELDLARWLTERYCLYTVNPRGTLLRGDIHHQLWPLSGVTCEIEENTLATAAGFSLPTTPPLLHYAPAIQVAIWPLTPA